MKIILKTLTAWLTLIVLAGVYAGCGDEMPIPPIDTTTVTPPDTTTDPPDTTTQELNYQFTEIYADSTFVADQITDNPQTQKILIEEFTGVRCTNCPAAHEVVADLLTNFSDQLIAVTFHAGSLSPPHSSSNQDFRTEEGNEMYSQFGITGVPSAMLNRHYSNYNRVHYNKNTWDDELEDLLAINSTSPVNLHVYHTYNASNRNLQVFTQVVCPAALTGEQRISLFLVEDNIIDVQSTSSGQINDYTHRHTFRTAITPVEGTVINTSLEAGSVWVKAANTLTIPNNWNTANCSVIAFIHRFDSANDDYEILQVAHIDAL